MLVSLRIVVVLAVQQGRMVTLIPDGIKGLAGHRGQWRGCSTHDGKPAGGSGLEGYRNAVNTHISVCFSVVAFQRAFR